MKCIKRDGEVRRVSNDEAMAKVAAGWSYCPKAEWKALKKASEPKPAAEGKDKESKSIKRRERKDNRKNSKYAQKKQRQERVGRVGENIDENYTQEAPVERQKTALEILDEMDD